MYPCVVIAHGGSAYICMEASIYIDPLKLGTYLKVNACLGYHGNAITVVLLKIQLFLLLVTLYQMMKNNF